MRHVESLGWSADEVKRVVFDSGHEPEDQRRPAAGRAPVTRSTADRSVLAEELRWVRVATTALVEGNLE